MSFSFSLGLYNVYVYIHTDLSLHLAAMVGASGTRNFITTLKFRSFAESANVTRDVLRFNPIYNEKSKGWFGGFFDFCWTIRLVLV